MIDMRYKPYFLPQVSAPFEIVLQKLDDEGINYDMVEVDPNELNASQGVTFSDEVENVNLDDMNPIWINGDMKILDGHHRWIKALLDNKKIKAVKIDMNEKDAARVLNKIQDIYEYDQVRGLEEVVNNDVINDENQADAGVSQSEFLASLEEDNTAIQTEKPSANPQTIIAYRKAPIRENSVVGNFFTLNPIDGYNKYEIEFDNLLDTNVLGVVYRDSQEPTDILGKIWFPNVNFEKLSEQYNTTSVNLKNKAIAEKAMKMGFDGIKYGDKLIQGLK
jgi:hypothetical protein